MNEDELASDGAGIGAPAVPERLAAEARQMYDRVASVSERTINEIEDAASEAILTWRELAGSTRETSRRLAEGSAAQTRESIERCMGLAERSYNVLEDGALQAWLAMRNVGLRALVMADTNLRAGLALAEQLAKAGSLNEMTALQREFLHAQADRIGSQLLELQSMGSQRAGTPAQTNGANGLLETEGKDCTRDPRSG